MKKPTTPTLAFLIPIVLLIGLITGFSMRPIIDQLINPQASTDVEEEDDQPQATEDEHHEEEHIALTQQAYQNLGLSISPVILSDYTDSLRMPGEIIESPGLSVQKVTASVSGRVSRLFTSPGISVSEGDPLCELQIVDDHLEEAQLRLLELLTKSEIVDTEIARLMPLTSTGSVAGRKQLELEYQKKELDSSLARTKQELGIRGLSRDQIQEIQKTRRAITTLTVRAPKSVAASQQPEVVEHPIAILSQLSSELPNHSDLTVEQLDVKSGQNVSRGEPICTLAAHGLLSISGHAFENEIGVVSKRAADDKPIEVEFGIGEQTTSKSGLKIQYVASKVDESIQSFRFFVQLPNEVITESTDYLGRTFRTWKYKVGQRVHILVPNREVSDQIVVPRDAVVREGPDAFVFREHIEEHDEDVSMINDIAANDDEDDHEDVFIELEPVPVTVLYQDRTHAVIKPGEELTVGDRIAMCSGYQLLLALKSQESGGGHHHHHH